MIARAGSGKTWTIIRGVAVRPRHQSAILCAFNKRIAEELSERLATAGNARAKTLHAIGFRAISRAIGRRITVDGGRERKLAFRVCGEQEPAEPVDSVAKIAQLAKEIAPDEAQNIERLIEIALDFGHAGDDDDDAGWDVARRARAAADVVALSREIDHEVSFADMLYVPLALKLQPDHADLVCIDEAQDMNLAQLRLAARVRKAGGRIVVVGDPRQAIYSWRGAAPGALERVADALNARRMPLTVTFRCARAIVEEARKLVPDLEAAPGATGGVIWQCRESEMIAMARPGDFVLSRVNAPLARVCLSILRAGTRAHIVGGADIGDALIKLVRKLSDPRQLSLAGDPMVAFLERLNRWREREHARAMARNRLRLAELVNDQAEMLASIAEGREDVAEVIETIERLFSTDGGPRVACSTIHRAKGLEADRVFILSSTLEQVRPQTPLGELEEANLRYVAITRAKRELVWVQP